MRRVVIGGLLAVLCAGCAEPAPPVPAKATAATPVELKVATKVESKAVAKATDAVAGPAVSRGVAETAHRIVHPQPVWTIDGRRILFDPERHPYLPFDKASIRLYNIVQFQFNNRQVTGGKQAGDGEFPWAVAILDKQGTQFVPHCGGALIAEGWVLTAAHCMVDQNDRLLIGSADLNSGATPVTIDDVCEHTAFVWETHIDSDLALVKLGEPRPGAILLPIDDGTIGLALSGTGTTIGWGRTETSGAWSPTLSRVEVPLPGDDACHAGFGSQLPASLFCGGFTEVRKGTALGDSGGPLVLPGPGSGGWVEAGVVSEAGTPGAFDLYTHVSPFAAWIRDTIKPDAPRCREARAH